MLKKIKVFFQCKLMGSHTWTSAAQEHQLPTGKQLEDGITGFYDYAKMYCKDCGDVSYISEGWQRND